MSTWFRTIFGVTMTVVLTASLAGCAEPRIDELQKIEVVPRTQRAIPIVDRLSAALTAFAGRNTLARAAAGLSVKITGFEPHVNADGWFFDVRVSNTSARTIRFAQGASSKAVVSHGRIVSALDAIDFATTAPRSVSLPSGRSMTVLADVADAGCPLSLDYTRFSPSLGHGVLSGYIDLGLVTQDGLDLAIVQRYSVGERRPVLH